MSPIGSSRFIKGEQVEYMFEYMAGVRDVARPLKYAS